MATKVKLESGLFIEILTPKERKSICKIIDKDVSPVGKYSLFTPQDNLEYFIISEKEVKMDKYEAVIKANNKTFKVKYSIYNQDAKINKAVRNVYSNEN